MTIFLTCRYSVKYSTNYTGEYSSPEIHYLVSIALGPTSPVKNTLGPDLSSPDPILVLGDLPVTFNV